jgi:hypothetical protein
MMAVPKVNRILGTTENWFVYAGEYLIGSVLFGILMAAVIEFPVLRVRDHLFPSRGRPLTTSGSKPNEEETNLASPPADGDTLTVNEPTAIGLNYVPTASPGGLDVGPGHPKSGG